MNHFFFFFFVLLIVVGSLRVWPGIGGFIRGSDLISARNLHANEGT